MQSFKKLAALALLFLAAFIVSAKKPADPQECEVCYKVMDDLEKSFTDKTNLEHMEDKIDKYCTQKDLGRKELKVCYFIKFIKREISSNFKKGMPGKDICQRKLKKQNPEICHVKYSIQTDDATDYSQYRIKQLKAMLAERNVVCNGCVEKEDFIKKLKETPHTEL